MTGLDGAIPRYLFRGFNKNSGADARLNTEFHIIPHAFLGPYDRYLCPDVTMVPEIDKITAIGTLYRRHGSNANCALCGHGIFWHKPVPLAGMSRARLSYEATCHLEGQYYRFASHFSSWTADLKIAQSFARDGPGSYIAILDTARRRSQNVILHVPLLHAAGLIEKHNAYPFEYLIYGTVKGTCYTCMTLGDLWQPSITHKSGKWLMNSALAQLCGGVVRRAMRYVWCAQPTVLKRCRFVRDPQSDPLDLNVPSEHWKPLEQDLSLFLTVVAANWSVWCHDTMTDQDLATGESTAIEKAVSGLSRLILKAAKDPNVVLPFVNPETYVERLPRVDLMIKLLRRIELEIVIERNRPPRYSFSW